MAHLASDRGGDDLEPTLIPTQDGEALGAEHVWFDACVPLPQRLRLLRRHVDRQLRLESGEPRRLVHRLRNRERRPHQIVAAGEPYGIVLGEFLRPGSDPA